MALRTLALPSKEWKSCSVADFQKIKLLHVGLCLYINEGAAKVDLEIRGV